MMLQGVQISRSSRRGCWLVIEPHYDDACFSYAGTMVAQRTTFDSLCILTIFSRSAYIVAGYASFVNERSVTKTVSTLRKAEGMRFAAAMAAETETCDLPEVLLRGYTATSAEPRVEDRLECRSRIQEAVRTMLARRPIGRLSFPLGAANHMDHKIVGDALLDLVADISAFLRQSEVLAYRESPYAFDDPLSVARRVSYVERKWPLILTPISQDTTDVMEQKLRLMGVFTSQLTDELSKIEAVDRQGMGDRPTCRELAWRVTGR